MQASAWLARLAPLVAPLFALLLAPLAGEAATAPTPPKLPLLLDGGTLSGEHPLTREVVLPTPGVWYLWLRVRATGQTPALLSWDLDGRQPLRGPRAQVLLPPFQSLQWVSYTRYAYGAGFRTEVYVDTPGPHTLSLRLLSGEAEVKQLALTLFFSAQPTRDGKTLDHRGDPGGGVAAFPLGDRSRDGFHPERQSPEVVAAGQAYYVDPAGDDANDGLSPARAWRTFAHVNSRRFAPGDALLLRRGGRWTEGLAPQGDGTVERWITLGAYGEGPRPWIDGGGRPAVCLQDQSYWGIQDLEVTNRAEPEPQNGIAVWATGTRPQPRGLRISNCISYDTGGDGISVGSAKDQGNGYDGVVIENCLSFANRGSGITVGGRDQNGGRNTVIRDCTAYSNPGMAGIWIHSGQNGLIEHCVGHNNACVNIWTWNSINVTIRECEAFRGRTPRDAAGFDIDWGCEACTLERCYAHDNEGVCILLMGDGHGEYRGFPKESRYNLCRYNVCEGSVNVLETFAHGLVHNNLVYTRGAALEVNGFPFGGWLSGGWPSDTEMVNNLLVATGSGVPLWVDDFATHQGNRLDYNLLWRQGAGPLVKWGGRQQGPAFWDGKGEEGRLPPQEFRSLAAFIAATGQEQHGVQAAPRLRAPGRGGIGRLPLPAYELLADSPAWSAGRHIEYDPAWLAARRAYLTDTGAEAYGIPMEPSPAREDYWGRPFDPAGRTAIGPAQRANGTTDEHR